MVFSINEMIAAFLLDPADFFDESSVGIFRNVEIRVREDLIKTVDHIEITDVAAVGNVSFQVGMGQFFV